MKTLNIYVGLDANKEATLIAVPKGEEPWEKPSRLLLTTPEIPSLTSLRFLRSASLVPPCG